MPPSLSNSLSNGLSMDDERRKQRLWILNGLLALAISGLLSIVVVVLRVISPKMLPANIFDLSLAVHVNLSVFVWPLAIMFSWAKQGLCATCAFYLGFAATLLIAASSLVPASTVFKSNYLPVIDNLPFFIGLASLATQMLLASIGSAISGFNKKDTAEWSNAIIVLIALLNCLQAYLIGVQDYQPENKMEFYENLFWGGGHTIQFAFTGLMIAAYAKLSAMEIPSYCYIINLLLAAATPAAYYLDNDQAAIASFFTNHMRIAGGIFPIVVILATAINGTLIKMISNPFVMCSAILFTYGGMLGFCTYTNNTSIPAHYHGSIVAVSIAVMGYTYKMLGTPGRLSRIQVYLYTLGQLMHISGLSWMGGYGALRKTAAMSLPASAKIAKIVFVAGGGVTLLSGIAFVLITIHSYVRKREGKDSESAPDR